ncbi:MAG: 16S rRNA (adenine(1518)-N(6)/adenine(1519)-N(6))-dimethyltransferase RsmA [Anaerolineae bacterium]|nr:MAG: 16S rRNA (adenine(1518)-N(6)/adenine(1519)-N(6))-dimethyltransferase RsmA [Anaerolineae bacterium]
MPAPSPEPLPPLRVAALLRAHGLRPSKRLGQNFLIDETALRKIVAAAEITARDTVLEVGAGLGSLTRYLAEVAQRVVAVELDRRLLPVLRAVLSGYTNIDIVQGDILALSPGDLVQSPDYLVVANIPYHITSALLRHLLEAHPRPRRMVLTVQKEVAERICATAGKMSLLALSVQVYGVPEIVARIPAGAFYPTPEVDSAVIRIDLSAGPRLPVTHLDEFFRLARAAFAQRRKTLRNALAAGLGISPEQAAERLRAAGIDPQRRAETLSLEEWERLTQTFLP